MLGATPAFPMDCPSCMAKLYVRGEYVKALLGICLAVALIVVVVLGSPWMLLGWLVCAAALAPVFVRAKELGAVSTTRTRVERIVLLLMLAAGAVLKFTGA